MPSYKVSNRTNDGYSTGTTERSYYGSDDLEMDYNSDKHSRRGNGDTVTRSGRTTTDRPPSYDSSNPAKQRSTRERKQENGHKRSTSVHQIPDLLEDEYYERGKWGSKAEFIIACLGFTVGIGNIWRFPYLAYMNGGSAFLIPYFIILLLVGIPLFYMEAALGQFSRLSPPQVWRCVPISVGVGVGMVVLCTIKAIYSILISTYSIIYFGSSLRGIGDKVPWEYCGSWWGAKEGCVVRSDLPKSDSQNLGCSQSFVEADCSSVALSNHHFYKQHVLAQGPGLTALGDLGGWKYDLPLALLFSWMVVFLAASKGIKTSGKVFYFTVLLPYCILIALLARALTLEGAVDGLLQLALPDWDKLQDPFVWKLAGEQVIFSMGLSLGVISMYSSYSRFHNRVQLDSFFLPILHFLTLILASCAVFSVLGIYSHKSGVELKHLIPTDEQMDFGPWVAFVALPEALTGFPLAWVWSALFFLMVFCLNLNSVLGLVETVLTAVYDTFPNLREHKAKVSGVFCLSFFLLGLPLTSFKGIFVYDLMERYGFAGFCVLWVALWQVVSLIWIYGFKNFSKDIALMVGTQPWWFNKVSWLVFSPILLLTLLIVSLAFIRFPLNPLHPQYAYPDWAHIFGWVLVGLSAAQVPLMALVMSFVFCCKRKILSIVKPTLAWGPGDPKVRRSILEEQSGIAPSRRTEYTTAAEIPDYAAAKQGYGNHGYDEQALAAYDM